MKIGPATPVFRCFDEAKARDFYVRYLGFSWDGEHRISEKAPLYAFLSKGALRLHLSEHYGDATPGSTMMVDVSDAQSLLEDLRSRGHDNANPDIEDLPWGKQISLKDPFGNTIRFLESEVGKKRLAQSAV
ncbi:MAG: glyoxalase superfamily protein [Pseudomonadota bacterium]